MEHLESTFDELVLSLESLHTISMSVLHGADVNLYYVQRDTFLNHLLNFQKIINDLFVINRHTPHFNLIKLHLAKIECEYLEVDQLILASVYK